MPRLPTQSDMAGPVSMAPQGATVKIPSPAPVYDAQMDIGRAIQGVGSAISAEIKIADKEAEREAKEDEALDVNSADTEYRTRADEVFRSTREAADDYDNWSGKFRTGVDQVAKEVLDRYPNLSPKARARLVGKWDGHDRIYVGRLENEAGRAREDARYSRTAQDVGRSMSAIVDPNSTMSPEEAGERLRQTIGIIENARKYLPERRVNSLYKEYITGDGPNSIIYQYGLREAAKEGESGVATGQMLRDIIDALPFAGRNPTMRPMGGVDPLTRAQETGNLTGSTYTGPMPRIDKLPDGKPFVPTEVPPEINRARPNFERGRMQLGVGADDKPIEIPYFTGSKNNPQYPGLQYGAFTLLPHRVGEDHRYGDTISINPLGAAQQRPINDPKRTSRPREGQLIHPEMGRQDNIGCISVPDGEWPKVKGAVEQMWKEHGKSNVVLVNAPGMTQIMSRKQYDAMYGGGGGAQVADAQPQAQPDGGNKRFLVLPGLKGTYGNDRAAFDEIAASYGGKADYLDGDPGFGGASADGRTSPQVKAAVAKLATGEYDGIIGFSAGGYNVRQILQSPEFKALPEEKQSRIKKVVAVGIAEEHLKGFKLDDRFGPEVYGNIGGAHLDAPRALAKQLGISPKQQTTAADLPKTETGAYQAVYRAAVAAGSPNPALTAAIAMHESAFGRSSMAQRANNLFGQTVTEQQVKEGRGGVTGATTGADGQAHAKYPSIEAAVKDHLRRWGKYYEGDGKATLGRMVENGYNVVDRGWAGKVGSYYDRFSKTVERTADAGAPPGRMNLGGPRDADGTDTGFVEEGDNDPAVAPGAVPTAAQRPEDAPASSAAGLENLDQGSGDEPIMPQTAGDISKLSARARILSHLSPEALLKLRTRTQTILTDSGRVFEKNAVAHMERTGEELRHPVTGQTYAEWARGVRQPQQGARGVRLIREAKMRYEIMADIGFVSPDELSKRLEDLRKTASPDDYAAIDRLEESVYNAYGRVEELRTKDPAQLVSGFNARKSGGLSRSFDIDENGRVSPIKREQGFAKPHPIITRALDDIKGDGLTGISIVEMPDGGLAINTSKAASPLVRQAAWDKYLSASMAAQQQIGIPEGQRRAITAHMAKTFMGVAPKDPAEFEKHWRGVADRVEKMVGPQWAPQVLREMRDFLVTKEDMPAADTSIDRIAREARRAGAGVGASPEASGVRARDMQRIDSLGRAINGETPAMDPSRPAIMPALPTSGANAQSMPANLMPTGTSGPARNMAPLPSEKVREWVKANANDPAAQQAIDLKFGRGAFARLVAEGKSKGWWPF